jgi:AP-1 complex subunit gamma-1
MTTTTENFIRDVVLADTIDQEREIVAEEQAAMRSVICDCDPSYRPRIISKLIFLAMRGIDTSWSQMEVVNMISHERFSYKQLAYLGCAVLLDETNERTVLITQTIQRDLKSSNFMIQSLALILLANMDLQKCFKPSPLILQIFSNLVISIFKKSCHCCFKIFKSKTRFN